MKIHYYYMKDSTSKKSKDWAKNIIILCGRKGVMAVTERNLVDCKSCKTILKRFL